MSLGRLVVVGAGDVGGRVAARWVALGGEAVGLTRTADRHDALRARGITPSTGSARAWVRPGDRVLLAVAGSAGQADAVRTLPGVALERAVLVSSTGIYGGASGVLGPSTPPGAGPRAQAAAEAETTFRQAVREDRRAIVRLGGLYRPGRGPQEALRRRGAAPPGPARRPLPLIHVDDAASALLAALTLPAPRSEPYVGVVLPSPTRRAFYEAACAALGLPAPPFADDSPGQERSFDVASFQADLLPEPAHPDWRDALSGLAR